MAVIKILRVDEYDDTEVHKAEKGLKCCTWNLFLLGMECRTRSSQNTGIAGMGGLTLP